MKSHIRLVPTAGMNYDQWVSYRYCGLGASDNGTVMGLNPYKASITLFYEKIGEIPVKNTTSLAAFLGKQQEPLLATMWEYYDPRIEDPKEAEQVMMRNYDSGNKVRRCKRINAYAHNDKYPHMFVSLDREINKHEWLGVQRGNGALELKEIGQREADKWEAGIPPYWVIQVQSQIMVCEFDYGEMATKVDNQSFTVLPFEKNPTICDAIEEQTTKFWAKVEAGRILATQKFEAQRNFNMKLVEQIDAELQSIEPEPDGSEAFSQYLKEKYKIALPGERPGNAIQLKHAQDHRAIKEQLKALEEAARTHENALKNDLGHEKADRLDFGPMGYVSWAANKNGVRTFLNKVK